MHAIRRQLLMRALQLFDLTVIACAALGGTLAYTNLGRFTFTEALSLRLKVSNFLMIVVFLMVAQVVFRLNRLYESRRLDGRLAEIWDIVKAVSFCAALIAAAALVFRIEIVTPAFVSVFWSASVVLLVMSRLILRRALAMFRVKGRNLRQMLIVGTNKRAVEVARRIESRPDLGYRLVGFCDESWAGAAGFRETGYPLVSDLRNLEQFLRENVVDEVVIGLPLKSRYAQVNEILRSCSKHGIIVRLSCGIFDLTSARTRAESFDEDTVVSVYTGQMDGWQVLAKGLLDILLSAVLIAILSPVLLLTAIVIKLTSPGPVLFVQERVGVNKRRFRLFKFRTMVVDAERRLAELEGLNEVSGPVFKIKHDPRITPVGRFLRKTSIDELPQLFNVVKGDMSLVGPRPLPVRDYNGFNEDWHRRRFSVRPGITCLWQVNGRSRISFDKWMELDMQYIDQWSFWLDLKILVRTIPAVLRGSGAA